MNKQRRLFFSNLILIVVGIAINFLLSFILTLLKQKMIIPLYLDTIGTILTSCLGGMIPGIIVGFFSNVLNSINDPVSLYYGILSVLIAITASQLSAKGRLKTPLGVIETVLVFSFIGGCLGTIITYLLYGFNFGEGISVNLAIFLYEKVLANKFWAQFSADVLIDLLDKAITVSLVIFVLRFIPKKVTNFFPYGFIYKRSEKGIFVYDKLRVKEAFARRKQSYKRLSLKDKVASMTVATASIMSFLVILIGSILYSNTMNKRFEVQCQSAANSMVLLIDGDRVEGYLREKASDEEYDATLEKLYDLRDCFEAIKYMYVYQIKEDGCHVVFDLDYEDVKASSLGDIIPIEEFYFDVIDDLIAGKDIAPRVTNGVYGNLLTVYEQIYDSEGKVVAYACCDIAMDSVFTDRIIYIIRLISLMFGSSMIIVAFVILFVEKKFVEPINEMAHITKAYVFDESKKTEWQKRLNSLKIDTGDEIENLYGSLKKMIQKMDDYVDDINEKANLITKMQGNIILSFANMVENRDDQTGGHIKRTSAYVAAICNSLRKNPKYHNALTPDLIHNIVMSAPLHDIGKIGISDTILNKPGKLTKEEFEIMKTHTTYGRSILIGALEGIEKENYLNEAIRMATSHHEKFDGTGYPSGLAGTDIPLSARIMAVADVFDALVSKRVYKEAMPFLDAVQVIKDSSGSHFDPDIVEAFLASLEEIKKISLAN